MTAALRALTYAASAVDVAARLRARRTSATVRGEVVAGRLGSTFG